MLKEYLLQPEVKQKVLKVLDRYLRRLSDYETFTIEQRDTIVKRILNNRLKEA